MRSFLGLGRPTPWTGIRRFLKLIDMRSFSNLWFWIVLAVLWSSGQPLGAGHVPYDLMVLRAQTQLGGAGSRSIWKIIVRINVNRLLYIAQVSGLWLLGFIVFCA